MKTILITGSTDGIGKLVAIELAKEGHRIFVHGRNEQKVDLTVKKVKEESNNENIEGFVGNLSDFASIKELSNSIKASTDQLDVLINNAGVFKSPNVKAPNGLDLRMMVNYLAPYTLTNELLPLLQNGNSPRLINLSSAAQSPVTESVLTGEVTIGVSQSYAQSKLALTMWSFDFAEKHPDIITIAVNPGSLLKTKMALEAYGDYWSTPDKGSNILFELATGEQHADKSGKYFDNDSGGYKQAHPDAYNPSKIKDLLDVTDKVIK
ncbi:SDR family NAD(P)-dependent oxidoreductase [Reichenbachiella versicolor]|uniref:SDR family NAD(P)-dependent oxidoreductase n=1 Tax=Reichenbachiella versicolor TaxID=1821036 RepID=UPI000D6E1A4B|nr:SDR family NAD(P)-dependent oxidoreductase [Reichenbachiella versicolor]